MKFHEAIDMILDGGITYRSSLPSYEYKFMKDRLYQVIDEEENQTCHTIFDKEDLLETDWVVEKDGVVYGEHPEHKLLLAPTVNLYDSVESGKCYCGSNEGNLYQSIVDKKEIFCEPCARGGMATARVFNMIRNGDLLVIKARIHEQDERAELEDKDNSWEEIKMPLNEKYKIDYEDVLKDTIAQMRIRIEMLDKLISLQDKLEGDWLEKKMLCFLLRFNLLSPHSPPLTHPTCSNGKCPFCFPQEQRKGSVTQKSYEKAIKDYVDGVTDDIEINHIPDVSKMVEGVREKVTVNDIEWLMWRYHLKRNEWESARERGASSEELLPLDTLHQKALQDFRKEIEYLVSLQEKAK